MSIDETSLSDGELYTVVSNKDAHGQKGALAAIVWGTKAEIVAEALQNIPLEKRKLVEEITLDLSPSMRSIVLRSFPKTKRTIDRFHIQQLASDAIQEIRIEHRWEALKADHKRKLITSASLETPILAKYCLLRSFPTVTLDHNCWPEADTCSSNHTRNGLILKRPEPRSSFMNIRISSWPMTWQNDFGRSLASAPGVL